MRRACPVAAGLLLALATSACGTGAGSSGPAVGLEAAGSRAGSAAASSATPATSPVEPAQLGRTAPSERVRFEPEQVVLPSGETASVVPARTAGGELVVPDDIRTVGWWDGSAYAGDLFGSTVIAGHVDAPRQGRGYFARLLRITPGETITVRGGGHAAAYRVVSVEAVLKDALSSASPPFDQRVGHRLVLMTCTGAFDPATRSYDQNLVVTAEPVGRAR